MFTARALILSLRPEQWIKNVFVLAPIIFSFEFFNVVSGVRVLAALLSFILLSSCVYVFNDILDVQEDRTHPRKKHRPIAAGRVTVRAALVLAALLGIGSISLLLFLPWGCWEVFLAYCVLQLLYMLFLKHLAILDVLSTATGFVLRVLMGGFAIGVSVSSWILLTTFLLAMFMAFGRRYHELSVKDYGQKRQSLRHYNKELLDRFIVVSCVAALSSYAVYAVETARALDKPALVATVVFVIFGILRYLQFLYFLKAGGAPEEIFIKDKVFVLNGVVWLLATVSILGL